MPGHLWCTAVEPCCPPHPWPGRHLRGDCLVCAGRPGDHARIGIDGHPRRRLEQLVGDAGARALADRHLTEIGNSHDGGRGRGEFELRSNGVDRELYGSGSIEAGNIGRLIGSRRTAALGNAHRLVLGNLDGGNRVETIRQFRRTVGRNEDCGIGGGRLSDGVAVGKDLHHVAAV